MARRLVMRNFLYAKIRRFVDPGLILVLLLSLFNLVPLASNLGLPDGNEVLYHVHRVVEMRQFEPLASSLTYSLTSMLQFGLGLDALEALRWLLLGSLVTCGGGMYLFCRRRSGKLGAALAGLLYACSPYLMYTEAYAHGAYPELLAFALFPLMLWRIDALRDKPSPRNFAAVFLLQIALISADPLIALSLTGISALWVAFETIIQHINREASQLRVGPGLLALFAMLLAILGSMSTWMPTLQASDSAHRANLSAAGVRANARDFVRLNELLSPAPIQDAGAINGLQALRIVGFAQWIAALTGALGAAALYVGSYRTRHPQAFLGAAFFGLLALALICLATPSSAGIWADLKPLHFLQSPLHLFGPLAACLAIVASMNGFWLEGLERRYQTGMIALAIALPIVTAIPLLYVPEWRHWQLEPALARYHELEVDRRVVRTAFTDEVRTRAAHSHALSEFGSVLSAMSVLMLGVSLWFLRGRNQSAPPYRSVPALSRTSLIGILLGGGIALLTFALTFREGIAWLHSPPGEALPADVRRRHMLADGLLLLGYDLSGDRLRAGETLSVNAYWHAPNELDVDYSSFLRLSRSGQPQAQINKLHPGGRPVSEWGTGDGYVIDRYELLIPQNLAAGDYDLTLGLTICEQSQYADCDNGYSTDVRNAGGALVGDSIRLATIRVDAG